jgi:outer membrane lipoprotein-sorting protein
MSALNRSLVFVCAFLLLIAIYVAASTRNTNAQSQQPVQTVEQARKNIQVIKGLPDSELVNLMNFVASSLGVRCEHCHVTAGKDPQTGFTKWIWESDDKPEKNTARRMMRMVMTINASNKADFRDNAVTCFTCHRGQLRPVGLPPMPLAKSGHEPDPNEPVITRPAVPSVEQIFAKYLEAVGGSAAAATKTMVMKGKREASQNRLWPTEIIWSGPDKFLLVTTTPQNVVRQIVNGENGWALAGPNLRTLGPKDVADNKRSWTELFGVVKLKDLTGFRSAGTAKIDNRDVYIVEKTTDAKTERYYFDAQNGLLVRKNTIESTVLVPLPDQIDFLDYRDVDGVKVPFTIRYSGIDTFNSWLRTFTEIKRNAAVDDSVFAKPVAPPPK